MKIIGLALAFAVALPAPDPAAAREYRLGSLTIDHPVLRVASPVSKTGAGYMAIINRGQTADRLLSVVTTASARADLHGTIANGAVMQMRAQTAGVPVPKGATVKFAPGGLHVMFIGLKAPMREGATLKARLIFEKAGPIDVEFKTEAAAGSHQH
ncbi:copper chaperone PCu(A)C [Sandarakinorhabdus sp.]|uniref:copper chaperone PCu(A)C n=1 Tax=Sandarakinorhabdus sp. TaxID=1916663 RepID=UPI0033419EEE